jgi:aryl-alcohol dehydrogenase-like predicted oxidoreductase
MIDAVIGRLGLGLAALGRPAYINLGREPGERSVAALRATTWAVLDEAYAAGVRWVDAARSYGLAEEFLAGWLAERGHQDLTVSSKWGYAYVGQWRTDAPVHEVKEHSLARFTAQLSETRALLGPALRLYQVHSLTIESPLWTDESLLDALAELRDSGITIGLSTSGPEQVAAITRALGVEVRGRPLFGAVQSTWNVLEPSAAPALAEARAAGLTVLVKEPLANGRLAVTPPSEVRDLAERHATGPDAIALAAALAQPWASIVLLGPASVAHLHANLAATAVTLTQADLGTLAPLAQPPATYWARRSALRWT